MKFTIMSLLYGLLVGWFASPGERPQLRPNPAKQLPEFPAAVACVDEPLTTPLPVSEEVSTTSSSGLTPAQPPERPVTIIEPTRRWVLSDKTWRSIVESTVNIDVCLDRGDEYIGVRIVLPFGS
jgi:hypothetical protein